MTVTPGPHLQLLDWRRQVHRLYDEVRRLRASQPVAAHARWRAGRDALCREHPQSPIRPEERASFTGLPYFHHDPDMVFFASVETDVASARVEIGTSAGGAASFERFGAVRLPIGSLDVYWLDAYGGGLFLPFRDTTAGEETYGAGRYLLDTVKGADLGSSPSGELVLDFNYAYHPSCAHDDRWACPLAPPGNHIDLPVRAGERL